MERLDICAMLSFLLPFAIHLQTLAPSVTFFDSGEFLTAAYSLGSAHSPGYPFFINYSKLFTFLPFGSIAFRVNIATAVSAAAACFAVYLLLTHLLAGETVAGDERQDRLTIRLTGLAAALTFACTPRLWLQSNHDKPYPLVAFIAALVFYLVLRWREDYRSGVERPAYVYLGAFLCGLAFGTHQTIILMVPVYAFMIIVWDWKILLRIKEMILALTFALIGFGVHLHLPVRATQNPLLNWGDAKTQSQFLWHFLRKGYPVEKPVRDFSLFWAQVNAFNIPFEFTLAGMALLLAGCLFFFRRQLHVILAFGVGIISFLAVIVGYFNTPGDLIFLTEEFFTPLYLLSAVLVGLGLFALLRQLVRLVPGTGMRPLPFMIAFWCLLFTLPVSIFARNFVENDQHLNFIAHDYATNSLRSLPQGAVLYTWGDSGAFPLWYLQGVERLRDDTVLLHTPHLVFTWYLDCFPEMFRSSVLRRISLETMTPENVLKIAMQEQLPLRPVYVDFSTRYSVPFDVFSLTQRGICYQIHLDPTGAVNQPDTAVWDLYSLRGLSGEMFFRDLDTGKAILIYANNHLEAGEALMRFGRYEEGERQFRQALEIAPEVKPQVDQIRAGFGLR
jgi:4-amino-4-deoxy-L-arabinose transferase-like glycosyltransferase